MKDKITVYAMFDNFLNFLNNNWNVQHRRNFVGLQDVASLGSVNARGSRTTSSARKDRSHHRRLHGAYSVAADNFINVSGSVWRIKVGVSYDF